MVYEGVRDVRRSVLLMKDPDDGDTDSDIAGSNASTNKTCDTLNPKDRDAFKYVNFRIFFIKFFIIFIN